MENNYTEEMTMAQMMDDIEKSMKRIHAGDIVKGKVIKVNEDEVLVNIGYMADGIISKEELSDDENIDPRDLLKPDDEIDVVILQVDERRKCYFIKKQADQVVVWDELNDYLLHQNSLEVTVKEVKGWRCSTNKV